MWKDCRCMRVCNLNITRNHRDELFSFDCLNFKRFWLLKNTSSNSTRGDILIISTLNCPFGWQCINIEFTRKYGILPETGLCYLLFWLWIFWEQRQKKLVKTVLKIKNNSKYNRYVNICMYNLVRKMCGTRWRRYLCFDTWVRFQIFFYKKTRCSAFKQYFYNV